MCSLLSTAGLEVALLVLPRVTFGEASGLQRRSH